MFAAHFSEEVVEEKIFPAIAAGLPPAAPGRVCLLPLQGGTTQAGMALLVEWKRLLFLCMVCRRTAAWQHPGGLGECGGRAGCGGWVGGQGSLTPTHTCGS